MMIATGLTDGPGPGADPRLLVDSRARPRRASRLRPTLAALVLAIAPAAATRGAEPEPSRYPTVAPAHKHTRMLLDNAMRYVAPANAMVDPVSGYPFEGWNHDPKGGVFLRSFTQLTAIGLYMELLANVVAGLADTPDLSRAEALTHLTRLVATLRHDQRDPSLGGKGLLVNFLDVAAGKRLGPLGSDVDRRSLLDAFGPDRGEALWQALRLKGWIIPRRDGREADIRRDAKFGHEFFDGPLAPFADEPTRQKVMAILDRRAIMVVFGDNANLSTSAAKSIGALLRPEVADRPEVARVRFDIEQFLNDQREGYHYLYDAKAGLFDFGWNATTNRLFGWDDAQGHWTTGHMDYFVNEFRGPATFVAARFEIAPDAIRNLGFKMKPYRLQSGRVVHVLAPWEGSAFQAMGLSLSLGELEHPSWRDLLRDTVEIEIDYATRKALPGFLSESYTGVGPQYTGAVGIPEITVSPRPRITDAASLYSLGVAYSIAPDRVEQFLGANWPVIATLLTSHGPWEGYNVARRDAVRFQTTAHTLSMVLGFLGSGSDHMKRYAKHAGFDARLDSFFAPGERVDLLADSTRVFAWSDKATPIQTSRDGRAFHVQGDRVKQLGIAFVSTRNEGVNIAGRRLTLRYRASRAIDPVLIDLKPPADASPSSSTALIATQIFARLAETGDREEEIQVQLPATIGLARIKEIVVSHESAADGGPVNLSITRFDLAPSAP